MREVIGEDDDSVHDALLRSTSVVERQRYAPAVAGRYVRRDENLERAQAFPAVGFRLCRSAKDIDHVLVVQRVTLTVDRCRSVTRTLHFCVIGVGVGEFPML